MQGLVTKVPELYHLISETRPLLVCTTETHVTEEIAEQEIEISDYTTITCYSHSRHTGGVTIYLHKNIKFKVLVNESSMEYWVLFISISIGNESVIVGAIYRSPAGSLETFLHYFTNVVEDNVVNQNQVLIMGDFNINMKGKSPGSTWLKNIIHSAGFKQIITEDTRVTNTSSTLIDLVITNMFHLTPLLDAYPKLSDHRIIGTTLEVNIEDTEHLYIRDLSKENIEKISLDLLEKNWNYESTDVNILYVNFINNIMLSVDKIAPKKYKRIKTNKKWFNHDIKKAQMERDNAYKKFQFTKLEEDWEEYKRKRNKTTCIIRKAIRNYYKRSIEDAKGDSRRMWKTVKGLVHRKGSDNTIKNVELQNNSDTVEQNFNNFYSHSLAEIANSIEDIGEEGEMVNLDSKEATKKLEKFNTISLNKLKKIVFNLKNKSTSDDVLSVKLIKSLFDVIGYPLLNLINTSLRSGCVPSELKVSVIVPIPKVKNPTQITDFRPINLLPVIDKILEIVIAEQLRNHFEEQNLLFRGQAGFREKHSCETSLQYVCATWREEINKGNIVISVFVDLKRAFETIDRQRLLQKLYSYGVKGHALTWITDYLSNRYHKTKINRNISDTVKSIYGVPQGSVLGPLLFITYVNDISNVLRNCYVNLFADDTLISVYGTDYAQVVQMINNVLHILYGWLCINKLKLNASKTKCMVLGTKHICQKFLSEKHVIKINNTVIEYVSEIKYLGVILDPQLTFSSHIDYLCKKIGKKIGFFNRISGVLSSWTKLLVYNTIIQPHFAYCASLLISCYKTDIRRLQLLQNKAMRIILNCSFHTSINLMLTSLNWLPIEMCIEKANVTLIFKIENNLVPEYLQSFLIKRQNMHSYPTRSANNYNIEFTKTLIVKKSLFSDGIRLFNALPNEIKESANLNKFVHNLTQWYLCKLN